MPEIPLPLPLRRQSGRDDIKSVEGYSISSTVGITSIFLAGSYAALVIAPSPYVFSTATNLCYLAAGFWREFLSVSDKHTVATLVGQLAGGPLILVFMGASSFAFHRESDVGSASHTLDIFFGWILVSHAFYVTLSVSVLALVRYSTRDARASTVVRTALSICFLAFVTVLMTFYDNVYRNQMLFYFITGPAAAVFGAVCRGILVWEEGEVRWQAVRVAIFELVVVLSAVFAAILSQGELLGRRLSRDTNIDGYDFYHGNWHFLLALVIGLLYSRAADTAKIIRGTHDVCVCTLPVLDWIAEMLILVYSILIIVFKEVDVDLNLARGVLGGLSGFFFMHAVVVLILWMLGDTGEALVTPRQLAPPRDAYIPMRQIPMSSMPAAPPTLTFRIRDVR